MRRLLPTLTGVTALVFSGLLVAAPPVTADRSGAPASAAAAVCTDVLLVAVPGDAQGAAGDPGGTLSALTGSLVAGTEALGRTVTTRVVHAETPTAAALQGRGDRRTAAQKAVTRAAWREWRSPVPTLMSGIGAALAETLPSCPDQLVHLVGQAQGAEALHRYLTGRADADLRTRIVSTVLVADPTRVSGSRGPIAGQPAAARKAQGVSARFARRPLPALPSDTWHGPVHSVCTAHDVVCDLGTTRFGAARAAHRSYTASQLAELGRRYAARLSLWPRPVPGQSVTGRVGLLVDGQLRADVAPSARRHLRFRATSALPPGLDLTRRGRLTGTPTRAGAYDVAYQVRNASGPAVSRPVRSTLAVDVEPGARAEVSAGGRHTCEIRTDGTLWCWGANFYGQLGTGDTAGGATPRQVGSHDDWVDVSAGGMHTCAIRENGTLWCWGLNYRSQLGLGNRKDRDTPRRVGEARDWESVSAGWVHTCATRTDGAAWCFGDNDFGQLGSGDQTDSAVPVKVTRGLVVSQLEAGGWHTCAVTRGGDAYCWGRNLKGQVGDGTTTLRTNPARVPGEGWISVQPSWSHTCGLSQGGQLSCWGGNEAGQLAGGTFAGSTTPRAVGGDRLWSAVQTGATSSCGLDTDQALWCWGTGRAGQLGDSTTRADQPVRLFEGTTWAQVDLGWLFGCGLTGTTSSASCWGNDETGELGATKPPARSAASARRAAGFGFNLVSFNVLGSNHTSPRTDAAEFTPARIRSEWMIDYLRSVKASVVGFQEIQRDQMTWFTKGAGATYDVWPGTAEGGDGLQTSIAWKKAQWRLLETDLVPIPFITQTRHMPLVKLEHRTTGRSIWVMNVHNAPQDRQQQRNVALQREIDRLKKVVGQGDPVFLVGDFNERHRAFCEVATQLDLVAPRGGSVENGKCNPPGGLVRIDWIFGSRDASYRGYREDRSPLVSLITDHSVLRTKVSVP